MRTRRRTRSRDRRGELGDRRRVEVVGGVGHAEPATEVDLVDGAAGRVTATSAASSATTAAASTYDSSAKICDPMWQWNPTRSHRVALHRRAARPRRAAPVDDGEPELRVVGAGVDVLVRVRLDAGSDAHAARVGGGQPSATRRSMRASSSNESTTMRPNPVREARRAARRRTCCCRASPCASRGEAGAARHEQASPPVATSRCRPSSRDEARHRGAQERLARVRHVVAAERLGVLAAPGPQLALVVDVERRAEHVGELLDVAPAHEPGARRSSTSRCGAAGRGRSARRRTSVVLVGSGIARIIVVVEPVHLVGRVDAEDRERARRDRGDTPRPATAGPG